MATDYDIARYMEATDYQGKIERLRAEVARLTQERDEAIAKERVTRLGLENAQQREAASIQRANDAELRMEKLREALKAQGDVYTREDMGAAVRLAKAQGRAEALKEAAAFIKGEGGVIPGVSAFARLLSRNNQPCMSGDARDRLNRLDRRAFDEATDALAAAILALAKQPPKGKTQ